LKGYFLPTNYRCTPYGKSRLGQINSQTNGGGKGSALIRQISGDAKKTSLGHKIELELHKIPSAVEG